MPSTTLLEIPPEEQAQMRAVLRCMRYGYLLAFHILLLYAAGRNPPEIVAFLFCSRSSVYRIVRANRTGSLGRRMNPDGQLSIAIRMTVLMQWLMRSLRALLKRRFSRRQIASQFHLRRAAFLKEYGWFVFCFVRAFPRQEFGTRQAYFGYSPAPSAASQQPA